ncbi:MAG: thermosome subunit alpha [Candidatus Woesearchaeota archaeon]
MNNNPIQPIFILSEGTQRTQGRPAQNANIAAAKAVSEAVRTTLGPKGMDKMIVDSIGDIIVTNDGVTILREMNVEHPAAKMIVEIAKSQEHEVGDGTTTAVVLAGTLLDEAEDLLDQNIHPTIIAKGYRIALDKALETLSKMAKPIMVQDTELLVQIASTAMTGKGSESARMHLSNLAVQASQSVYDSSNRTVPIEYIKIEEKSGGDISNSEMIRGIVLDKERVHPSMPLKIVNAKIALVDIPIEIKNTEMDAKISITDPGQVQAFLDMEERMLKGMVEKISNAGATVLLCQKGIDDVAQHYLAKKGILAVRRVSKSDLEKIGKAVGARIISNLEDMNPRDLGSAGSVVEEQVGEERMLFIRDCENPKAVTILLRASTEHVLGEVKRAVDDALGDLSSALKNGRIVSGAGASESEVAKDLRRLADSYTGREQLAILAYAKAMEIIPKTLAENCGLDPIDVITELRSAHEKGLINHGLNVDNGECHDAYKAGIIEPLSVKTRALSASTEVSTMILRIDDVISSAPTGQKKEPDMNEMPFRQ